LEGHDGFTSCGAAMQSASKLTLVIIYIVVKTIEVIRTDEKSTYRMRTCGRA
jgi:hypothetical protein